MSIARLLTRLFVGVFMIGHGTQKLFGWFDGPGLDQTAHGFEQIGLRPGRRQAALAGATETAAGTMILTGAATPLAASMVTGVMLTAIDRVHRKNGPWNTNGGYEYNAVLIAVVLTLAEAGPGDLSVDGRDGPHGTRWAIAALAGGIAGALGLRMLTQRPAPVAVEDEQQAQPAVQEHPAAA
jgi:putative oxidoreductase